MVSQSGWLALRRDKSDQCGSQRARYPAGVPPTASTTCGHATASFLLVQGFTREDVKNQLGHSSIVLTSNTYGHVLEQRQREVARAMDVVLRSRS